MPSPKSASVLFAFSVAASVAAQDCSQVCQSFGKDFVDGGTYFQNVASTANFTATEYFQGCQDDFAYNILQDPEGNQYSCNNTPMTPDNAIQALTCGIQKNQLSSGEWSIVVLSNNGQCDPIDYFRTFSLSVGTQATSTVQATIVATSTSTPVITSTSTVTSDVTSTAKATTTTVQRANPSTFTSTPFPAFTLVTRGIVSVTQTVQAPSVASTITTTTTKACTAAAHAAFVAKSDQVNTKIQVTIIPGLHLGLDIQQRDAMPEPTARAGSLEHKRAMLEGRSQVVQEAKIQQRDIEKRAPDQPTITVTSSSTISTTTITASSTTVYATTTSIVTSTTTPVVTVTRGQAPPKTVTAVQQTITNTLYIPLTVVTTTRYTTTVTASATATKCT